MTGIPLIGPLRTPLGGTHFMAVGAVTVSVAALVVTEPTTLVNVAVYSALFSAAVTSVRVSVSDVAPAIGFQVFPPSVDTDHWTVGVGLPLAVAVNVAFWPTSTVVFCGWPVTAGAVWTGGGGGAGHRQLHHVVEESRRSW